MSGTHSGNIIPSITQEEHRSVNGVNGKATFVYGFDGTNVQPIKTDSSGIVQTAAGVTRANVSDQNTTITSSTAATTIVTADATHYLDLVSLVLTNISATGTEVQLFNDDGTTVRSVFYVPANDTRGIVFSTPFTQAAVNNAWKLKTVTSIASLKVTAQFVKNS